MKSFALVILILVSMASPSPAQVAAQDANLTTNVADAIIRRELSEITDVNDLAKLLPALNERLEMKSKSNDMQGVFGAHMDLAMSHFYLKDPSTSLKHFQEAVEISKSFVPEGEAELPSSFGCIKTEMLDQFDLGFLANRFKQGFPDFNDVQPTALGWSTWSSGPPSPHPMSISIPKVVGWLSFADDKLQLEHDWHRGLAGLIEAGHFRPPSDAQGGKPFLLAGMHVFPRSREFANWLRDTQGDFDELREFESDDRRMLFLDQGLDDSVSSALQVGDQAELVASIGEKLTLNLTRGEASEIDLNVRLQVASDPEVDAGSLGDALSEYLLAYLKYGFGDALENQEFFALLDGLISEARWQKSRNERGESSPVYEMTVGISKEQIAGFRKQMVASMSEAKRFAQWMQWRNSVKQLSFLLVSRYINDRKWPRAYSVNGDGEPLLSWRVHLLPFLGEKERALYKEFHLDEPWDSPHNRRLVSRIPSVYQTPGTTPDGKTSILLVTGEGTRWPRGDQPTNDGLSENPSLLLVTVDKAAAVAWTAPSDFQIDSDNDKFLALSTEFAKGAPVALSNGELRIADPDAKLEWIRYLSAVNGQPWTGSDQEDPNNFFANYQEDKLAEKAQSALVELEKIGKELGYFRLRSKKDLHPTIVTDEEFDSLPQYSVDSNGSPLLSWRVHALSLLGHESLYERFNLDEPWDSATNRSLISEMPEIFCHPDDQAADGKTRYQLLVGRGTDYADRVGPAKKRTWKRAVSRNIVVVSTPGDKAVEWTRPNDFDVAELKALLDKLCTGSEPINCVLDNASVLRIDSSTDRDLINDWITSEIETRSPQQKLQRINVALHEMAKANKAGKAKRDADDIDRGLSWRVHILPYLGLDELYSQFDLSEPWDSDHNRSLIEKMPRIFSFSEEDLVAGKTPIVRLTGPGSAAENLDKGAFVYKGGKEWLQLLTVNSENEVTWTRPGDLTIPEDHLTRDGVPGALLSKPSKTPFSGRLLEMSAIRFHHPLFRKEMRAGFSDDNEISGVPVAFIDSLSGGGTGLMSEALPPSVWQDAMLAFRGIFVHDLEQANLDVQEKAAITKLPPCTSFLPAVVWLDAKEKSGTKERLSR